MAGVAAWGVDRVTYYLEEPRIPARPASYVWDPRGIDDEHDRDFRDVLGELGWPEAVLYQDAGREGASRSQLAALSDAIAAGRHDGVIATHPSQLGSLDEIEAFDRFCRAHNVLLRFRWCYSATDTRALYDVVEKGTEFTVTDEHLRLLRHAYVFWEEAEFGAPSIDPKRPYGNSHVISDIAEILGVPESEWAADEEMNPSVDAEWRFLRVHVETAIALQIALFTGEFRAGRYVRDDQYDTRTWRRVDA
jgi:hypothetical protein